MTTWNNLLLYLNDIFKNDDTDCGNSFKHTKIFCKNNNLNFKRIRSFVNLLDDVGCDCSLLNNSARFINPAQNINEKPDIDTSLFWNNLFHYVIEKNNAVPHPAIMGEYIFRNHEGLKYTKEFCELHNFNFTKILDILKLTNVKSGLNCDCNIINDASRFFDPFMSVGTVPTIYPYDENVLRSLGVDPPSRYPKKP